MNKFNIGDLVVFKGYRLNDTLPWSEENHHKDHPLTGRIYEIELVRENSEFTYFLALDDGDSLPVYEDEVEIIYTC